MGKAELFFHIFVNKKSSSFFIKEETKEFFHENWYF